MVSHLSAAASFTADSNPLHLAISLVAPLGQILIILPNIPLCTLPFQLIFPLGKSSIVIDGQDAAFFHPAEKRMISSTHAALLIHTGSDE